MSAAIGVDDSGASGVNRTQIFNATLIGNPGGPGTPAFSVLNTGFVPTLPNIAIYFSIAKLTDHIAVVPMNWA